jgi:hypothetical protein
MIFRHRSMHLNTPHMRSRKANDAASAIRFHPGDSSCNFGGKTELYNREYARDGQGLRRSCRISRIGYQQERVPSPGHPENYAALNASGASGTSTRSSSNSVSPSSTDTPTVNAPQANRRSEADQSGRIRTKCTTSGRRDGAWFRRAAPAGFKAPRSKGFVNRADGNWCCSQASGSDFAQ